jgi:hypothetical protein
MSRCAVTPYHAEPARLVAGTRRSIVAAGVRTRRPSFLWACGMVLVGSRVKCHGTTDMAALSAAVSSAGSRLQTRRQGINLLLQLSDAAVRLLLPLPGRHGDDAVPARLFAPLARGILVVWIGLASHLEAAAGLAGPRFPGIMAVWIEPSRTTGLVAMVLLSIAGAGIASGIAKSFARIVICGELTGRGRSARCRRACFRAGAIVVGIVSAVSPSQSWIKLHDSRSDEKDVLGPLSPKYKQGRALGVGCTSMYDTQLGTIGSTAGRQDGETAFRAFRQILSTGNGNDHPHQETGVKREAYEAKDAQSARKTR